MLVNSLSKSPIVLSTNNKKMSCSKTPLFSKKKVNPLMNVFVGGAGLVATLAVVAGIYTFNNNKVNNQLGSSMPKTTHQSGRATISGKASISALSLPQPSDVVSIKWDHSFFGKPNHTWTKTNGASTIDQVMGWLNSAQIVESEPIGSVQKGGKSGITITTQNGTTVDVSLAYNVNTVKQSNGTSQSSWIYQKGYLVVSNHGFQNFQKPVRIYSPELANWIWNGWYGNTSVTPQGGTPTTWVEFTSAGLVSTYYILTNEHIPAVGGYWVALT
jgi:hypothetical protein